MSHYRNNESDRNRDPRQRDRSRSEIRRTDHTDTLPSLSNTNQSSVKQEQLPSTNSVSDFLKTLGLNAQLIQALINANPPKPEQIQVSQPQQPIVNNAQEFASFLSKSYGLDSSVNLPSNQSINRDPRRRQTSSIISTPPLSIDNSLSKLDPQLIVNPSNPIGTSNTLLNVNNNPSSPISIDELYKQFLCSIDQTLLDDQTRQRFQRITLLDNELDKLHRMNIELTKTIERRSRRRISTKDIDPLLKENENLQNELINYIRTLKTTIINNYSTYMLYNNMILTTRR